MNRGWLAASLLFCLVGADAKASGWKHAGWYIERPYIPGPEEIKVVGAYQFLGGPYRSKNICETARVDLHVAEAHCRHYRRIKVIEPSPQEPAIMPHS
jgi:hypothetical protein